MNKDWNDLVFENRNKTYGAYALRQNYSKNIIVSCLLSILFVLILIRSVEKDTNVVSGDFEKEIGLRRKV